MADISTAVSMARVPILGEDGRISDDYIPAAIGEGVENAEAAAKRAETAAKGAQSSAIAASQSATGAQGSALAASVSATKAQESATAASEAVTQAQSAQQAAEAAKTAAETAQSAAAGSAQDAQQSATAAAQSAASVADKFITSAQATTLEPGSQATASVADQVLTIGVPRGEKGDKGDTGEKGDPGDVSAVNAAEGSDLSVSTDEGTVTIDDSALRERIAELENQAANVVTGTSTGLVAHGEDAFPQKPREVRVKGKTWVNRWPAINGTTNGITVTTDETGLITVTGTATANTNILGRRVNIKQNGQYYILTTLPATSVMNSTFWLIIARADNDATVRGVGSENNGLFQAGNYDKIDCSVYVLEGQTVNASFRVMLVDGTEAPDCFTPCASITSVQPEKLVTAGKNLLPESNEDLQSIYLEPGTYVFSADFDSGGSEWFINSPDDVYDGTIPALSDGTSFTIPYAGNWIVHKYGVTASNAQIELGSTATAYEPPTVTETALPEVELRGLPNGTCDELVIKADGTCEVERNTVQVTFDGTQTIAIGATSAYQYVTHNTEYEYILVGSGNIYSDRFPSSGAVVNSAYLAEGSMNKLAVVFTFPLDTFATNNEAEEWFASNPTTVVFTTTTTTEPQSPVTLPALPAPTFNQYHDSAVPSDTSTEYARDINIVLDNLAKQVAGTASAVAVREASTIEEE